LGLFGIANKAALSAAMIRAPVPSGNVAIITSLARRLEAVSAHFNTARLPAVCGGAVPARLGATGAVAAIAVGGVAVVARLVTGTDSIAAICSAHINGISQSTIACVSALHCARGRAPIICMIVSIITEILHLQFSTEREAIAAHLVAVKPHAIRRSA
jgi:hypothetical protein